jgi:hypothetical protein
MREKVAMAGAKFAKDTMRNASPKIASALGDLGFDKEQMQAKAMQKIEDCVARSSGPLQVRTVLRGCLCCGLFLCGSGLVVCLICFFVFFVFLFYCCLYRRMVFAFALIVAFAVGFACVYCGRERDDDFCSCHSRRVVCVGELMC